MIGFFFFFCNGNTRVFWTFIELHFSFPYFLFIIVCSSLLPFDSIYILHFLFYHFPSPPLLFHCFYRVLIFFPFLYLGCLFKLFFLLLPIFALLFFHFWAVFMPLFPTFLCIHPDKLSTPHFFIICSINYALCTIAHKTALRIVIVSCQKHLPSFLCTLFFLASFYPSFSCIFSFLTFCPILFRWYYSNNIPVLPLYVSAADHLMEFGAEWCSTVTPESLWRMDVGNIKTSLAVILSRSYLTLSVCDRLKGNIDIAPHSFKAFEEKIKGWMSLKEKDKRTEI